MRLVIADTGPVNYLILMSHISVLHALFEKVTLPVAVRNELASSKAPAAVSKWNADLPPWIGVRKAPASHADDPSLKHSMLVKGRRFIWRLCFMLICY